MKGRSRAGKGTNPSEGPYGGQLKLWQYLVPKEGTLLSFPKAICPVSVIKRQ